MTTTRFRIHPSPVGDLLLLTGDAGLIGLDVLDMPLGAALGDWAERLGHTPVPRDDDDDALLAQLDEYFDGERVAFDVAVDLSLVAGFTRAALEAVREVPYGETASYGEVAVLAGNPRAHRAVGTACGRTPISIVVPVHRVVRADGSIGEYGGRPEIKRALLELEAAHRPAGV